MSKSRNTVTVYDTTSWANQCETQKLRVPHNIVISSRSGWGMLLLLLLGRLGHNLSVREDLAGFVVAAHTGDVLPRLIRHVTLSVIQHNDVLDRRQKLKLALFGFGFGTAGLDGAGEC